MKLKLLLWLFSVWLFLLSEAQVIEPLGERFLYRANGNLKFYRYELIKKQDTILSDSFSTNFKLTPDNLKFTIANILSSRDGFGVVLLKPIVDTGEACKEVLNKKSCKNMFKDKSDTFINPADRGQLFWMRKEEFEKLSKENFIVKRFFRRISPTFGASLSLPFKMREKVDTFNMKITPELALGGYFGPRLRLKSYRDIFISLPITLGVTTIGINSNNTIKEVRNPQNLAYNDGLVLGRTFTVGLVFEYLTFQSGIVAGWDKAGGQIGEKWVYNDRMWLSFSIGFNFLQKNLSKD